MQLRLQHFQALDSTSEEAFRQLAAGTARHGDAFVADSQTAGRGRRGNRWTTSKGEAIAFSVVVEPPASPRTHPALLTLIGGLVVLDIARGAGVKGARLKWPNDLLIEDAKVAGVLVESRGIAGAPLAYVLGIGLNVTQRSFPQELLRERPVTSLYLAGADLSVAQALDALTHSLSTRLTKALAAPDNRALETEYLEGLDLRPGSPIRVRFHGDREPAEGNLISFSLADGFLLRDRTTGTPLHAPTEHIAKLDR